MTTIGIVLFDDAEELDFARDVQRAVEYDPAPPYAYDA
jgi:hypothetical protein